MKMYCRNEKMSKNIFNSNPALNIQISRKCFDYLTASSSPFFSLPTVVKNYYKHIYYNTN